MEGNCSGGDGVHVGFGLLGPIAIAIHASLCIAAHSYILAARLWCLALGSYGKDGRRRSESVRSTR